MGIVMRLGGINSGSIIDAAPVVRLSDVTKSFGDLEVVKELSLGIKEGEFLTLLGPSGCGKTTTLRLISGFELPDSGEIFIGKELVNGVPPFRRNVNTVFQSYALFPHLTVFDNVAYGLTVKRLPKAQLRTRVFEMLERVGLVAKVKSLPHQLSGGEMQRTALARALVNQPRVLLLDEPLSALDAKLRRAMQLELKHMQSGLGITFLYVTHDQEEALVMSDRIAVMNAGRIEHLGAPSEVFERPSSRFVAEFLGIGNLLHGKVAGRTSRHIQISLNERVVIQAMAQDNLAIGDRVVVGIRPQKIQIRIGAAAADNSLRGRLAEVIYVGSLVRLVFAMDDGLTLEAESLSDNLPFDYRCLDPSDAVTLVLPSEALLLYRD